MDQNNAPATAGNPEFAAILNQAKDVDGAAHTAVHGESQETAQPAEVIDPVAAWAEIPEMVGSLLTMFAPELKPVYAKPQCLAWGAAMARLAEKRGWDASGLPPEVAVLMTSSIFIVPTVIVIKQKRAAMAAKAAKPGDSQLQGAADGQGS